MSINITLDVKSVNSARRKLEKLKNAMPKMLEQFIVRCLQDIRDRANTNIKTLDLGENVKAGLIASWRIEKGALGRYRLINTFEKACYVEFGTGFVGEQDKHPNADETGYRYNVPSESKDEVSGLWFFYENEDNFDLPSEAIVAMAYFNERDRERYRRLVITRGAVGAMFLYNAFMDFYTSNSQVVIWQSIVAKYLR